MHTFRVQLASSTEKKKYEKRCSLKIYILWTEVQYVWGVIMKIKSEKV